MRTLITELMRLATAALATDTGLAVTDRDAAMLCRVGLGPLAFALTERHGIGVTANSRQLLQGASLTAQLIHRRTSQAVGELLDTCGRNGITPVLLKGISVATEYYEPSFARTMGDVDILVADADLAATDDLTAALGYLPDDNEKLDGPHHHLQAVRHPESGVILELHSALFPARSFISRSPPFRAGEWQQHTVASTYAGRPVLRLRPEYQLAYTIAHWASDRKWPVNVFGVLDAVLIAKNNKDIDWEVFRQWMQCDEWFAACATVLFTFIEQSAILPAPLPLRAVLDTATGQFGERNIRALHWLLCSMPMAGKERALWLIDHRAARIAWQSMLTPGASFASRFAALRNVLSDRWSRTGLNPLRLARRVKAALRA